MHRKNFIKSTLLCSAGVLAGLEMFSSCKKEDKNFIVLSDKLHYADSHMSQLKKNNESIYMVVQNLSVGKSEIFKRKFNTDFALTCDVFKTVKKSKSLSGRTGLKHAEAHSTKKLFKKSAFLKEKNTINFDDSVFEIKVFEKAIKRLALPCDEKGNLIAELNISLISNKQFDEMFSSKLLKPLIS